MTIIRDLTAAWADAKADEGRAIEVYDIGRKRWYRGKVLFVWALGEDDKPKTWEVELRNGNRGSWDREFVRFP